MSFYILSKSNVYLAALCWLLPLSLVAMKENRCPPLFKAVKSENLEKIKDLIRCKADPNIKYGGFKNTALFHAVETENLEIVKYLVENKADIHIKDLSGMNALGCCNVDTIDENFTLIKYLVESKIDINTKNSGSTLLHEAINRENANSNLIKYLLCHKSDPHALNDRDETPLFYANKVEQVKNLLEANAHTNIKNMHGKTPLHLFVERGNLELIELLLSQNADVNAQTNNHRTPLHRAITMDKNKISQSVLNNVITLFLCNDNIDLNLKGSISVRNHLQSLTPYELALTLEKNEIAQLLTNDGVLAERSLKKFGTKSRFKGQILQQMGMISLCKKQPAILLCFIRRANKKPIKKTNKEPINLNTLPNTYNLNFKQKPESKRVRNNNKFACTISGTNRTVEKK